MRWRHNRCYIYDQDSDKPNKRLMPYPYENELDGEKKLDLFYTTDSTDLKDLPYLTFVRVSENEKFNIMEFFNTQGTINSFKMRKKKEIKENATSES